MSKTKRILINQVITHLQDELLILISAVKTAHLAATDEQSIAETQYDTLAIEAGYLAQGQSRRVVELQQAISLFQKLVIKPYFNTVSLGALVQLTKNQENNSWFFIAPAAAGFQSKIGNKSITLVTPEAPLGKALFGKKLHDEIMNSASSILAVDEISAIK
jgi:transcription elongation GreA/GreB family factor